MPLEFALIFLCPQMTIQIYFAYREKEREGERERKREWESKRDRKGESKRERDKGIWKLKEGDLKIDIQTEKEKKERYIEIWAWNPHVFYPPGFENF